MNDTFHTASNRSWVGPGNEASVCVCMYSILTCCGGGYPWEEGGGGGGGGGVHDKKERD